MRIKVSLPLADAKLLREKVLEGAEKVEHDETTRMQEDWEAVCLHKTFCGSLLNNFF
jgi:ribosome maturation protein SDO1